MGKNEINASRSLATLQMFKLSQPTPATLSLVRAYKDKKIKYAKLRDTLKAIEKFHFLFTAITSSRSSGGISAMYSSFAKKLFEASDSSSASDEIQILISKLQARVPSLAEFKVAFNEIIYTNSNSKHKNLVRYILREFYEYFSYNFPVDFDELTIEHIHPQSMADNDDWPEEVVGCLGNLIYLDEDMNGKLDTKSFDEKKTLLINNGYKLPEFIINAEEWSPDTVINHTNEMAETAYNKIWKI